eukprot:CAMPEP_0113639580 /NCGR_PEP_ID=MMETSP0017_2-20120614/20766_1 /TAXON_ID=2856 /ORGANISM="Cylindrotheca closterium" /LENGTH=313 /DNA_ID=CAMNT_0000550805 /DNA_START=261 /DNA_END=1202 /DNA_ORIENTATION=- /assembly_acc=CAM_ASM_000147
MNIATMNILEPRPIDPRGMIPVENVSLVQSSLNDRILLDLHPLLEMERMDFQSSRKHQAPWGQTPSSAYRGAFQDDDSSSKKMPAKVSSDSSPKEKLSHFAADLSTLLMASSTVDETAEPITTHAASMKQVADADGSYSAELDNLPKAGGPEPSSDPLFFRSSQLEQWNYRYQELVQFKKENNHCSVPLHYPKNSSLAHWVKRQRHQYRMKKENKHSTLTDQRQEMLESLGFIWDSHAAAWDERWNQLSQFRDEHGHSRVPKNYPPNPPLAIWVKCQRRQFKLFSQGKHCNMNIERIRMLKALDFVFDPRASK